MRDLLLPVDRPYGDRVRMSWEPSTDGARLKLAGEVDFSTVATLRDAGMQAMSQPGCNRLTIDLSEVTFLDSMGIGVLVELRNTTIDKGMSLIVAYPSEAVRRLLELTGLEPFFTIEQDR